MKPHYLKKCDSIRATEEMPLSLYCVLGNEYCGAAELPAIALSPASSDTCNYHDTAETGRRMMRSPDLEAVDNWQSECFFGTEISTSMGVNFSGEATSPVEICGDLQRVMATEKPKLAPGENPQKKTLACVAKTPSAAELEEFFTEAEEYVQTRFAEKYNYDIVKDAPISGGSFEPSDEVVPRNDEVVTTNLRVRNDQLVPEKLRVQNVEVKPELCKPELLRDPELIRVRKPELCESELMRVRKNELELCESELMRARKNELEAELLRRQNAELEPELQFKGPVTRLRAKNLQGYLQVLIRKKFEDLEDARSSHILVNLLTNEDRI